jgi:hypothetical protein
VLDHDLKRFEDELKDTGDGLKLRLAMHEAKIAVHQIARLRRVGGPALRAVESWRVAYIRACDHASQAVDRLWNTYQWPQDAARERSYEWRPAERRRR